MSLSIFNSVNTTNKPHKNKKYRSIDITNKREDNSYNSLKIAEG